MLIKIKMIKTQGELGAIECQHNSETGKYVLENILMGLARKHAMCDTKLVFSPSCWVRTLMDKGASRATNMSSTGVNIKSVGRLWGAWSILSLRGGLRGREVGRAEWEAGLAERS